MCALVLFLARGMFPYYAHWLIVVFRLERKCFVRLQSKRLIFTERALHDCSLLGCISQEAMKFSKFKTQGVWEHFLREDVNGRPGSHAQCVHCKSNLACAGGSTSTLHNHLKVKHTINVLKRQSATNTSSNESSSNSHPALEDRTSGK